MSAGSFSRSKYELSAVAGVVVPIRVQPETLSLAVGSNTNAAPTADITSGWPSAQVSGGRRGLGIYARTASFVITGTPPTGYKAGSVLTLPILNKALAAAIDRGVTGTYTIGGEPRAIEFIAKPRGEVIR